MDYFPKLRVIKAKCEKAFSDLEEINPDHELLLYDGTGLCRPEQEQLTDRLMAEFGGDNYNSDCPTDKELCMAFQSLHNALQAAVIIEKAKSGFFG